MIIWQGAGLAVVIFFAIPIALLEFSKGIFGRGPWEDGVFAVGNVLAAVACWYAGRYLHQKQGRDLVDPKTGEAVILRRSHTLMFVKFEYWSVLFVLVAILNLLK